MTHRNENNQPHHDAHKTRATIWEWLFVSAISVIATCWLFIRVLGSMNSVVAADGYIGINDGYQNVWMLWWTAEALRRGTNPFLTDSIFYPLQINLFWQTLNITNGLLALPVTYGFGPVAAYNAVAMASFVCSALAMYWLARVLTGSPVGAGCAAMIYAFSSFHVGKLFDGQLEIMSIQYFPLLTLGLFYSSSRKSWIAALMSGLLIVWILLTSLYYGFFALVYIGLFSAVFVLVYRPPYREVLRLAGRLIVIALPPIILLLSQIREILNDTGPENGGDIRQILHSATPLDFFLPSPHHPLWGDAVVAIQSYLHPGAVMVNISLGTLIWPLAIIGAVALFRQRQARLHSVLVISSMLLALGPWLVWNDHTTSIPLPYVLLNLLPGVRSGQRPNHFIVIAAVHLCLLAAFGIQWLLARSRPSGRIVLLGALVGLLIIDLLPVPVPGVTYHLPPVYSAIPPGSGAILEMPFQMDQSGPLFAQITHRRPLIGSYMARTPEYPFNRVDGISMVWFGKSEPTILSDDWLQSLISAMSAQNIDYILVHRDLLSSRYERIADQLAKRFVLAYTDDQTTLYQRPTLAQPQITIALDTGWYELERVGADRWQWTSKRATISVFNPYPSTRTTQFELRMRSYDSSKSVAVSLRQAAVAPVAIGTIPIAPAYRTYRLLVAVPPGYSQLQLEVDQTERALPDTRRLGALVQLMSLVDLPSGMAP
ncbi:hypothetical protein K2Z83_08135 [Oscillochloris sp. ZM17-4]|uniref:hypothetical protein n=1 Tax=Oscillochloris sp. ZM17-4 TaxID=2866714 RepID=UPI001C72C5C4|nr:hypothetical protein [Oscillochloris sp. ZM17-4]MBX0327644.1 hypothetical protein [Oscillochloris sp. ZM17-4]